MPGIPPLRITNTDGTFNQIPVFELELSGGTLTSLSPSKVRLQIAGGQGPSGPAGSSIVYAPTGGPYITFVANDTLSAEKVLTAGSSVTTHTDGSNFYVNALTSDVSGFQDSITFPLVVASGGTGRDDTGGYSTLLGFSDNAYQFFTLAPSNNMVIRSDGTTIFFEAQTSGEAAGIVYAPTGGEYLTFAANGTLTAEKVLTASDNITIVTDSTTLWISANTGAGGGGGTFAQKIPMGLQTVNPDNANAFWTVKTGTSVEQTFVGFLDQSNGVAQYHVNVPSKISSTENWTIIFEHAADSGSGGDVNLTFTVNLSSDGSTIDGSTTEVHAGAFSVRTSGVLTVSSLPLVKDDTLGLSSNEYLRLVILRAGADSSDTNTGQWNLHNVYLRSDIDS